MSRQKLQKSIAKSTLLLQESQSVAFFSSFSFASLTPLESLDRILKNRLHQISFDTYYLENILDWANNHLLGLSQPSSFVCDPDVNRAISSDFFKNLYVPGHSQNCQLFMEFKEKYARISDQSAAAINIFNSLFDHQSLKTQFLENAVLEFEANDDFMAKLIPKDTRINSKTAKLNISKAFGCFLVIAKHLKHHQAAKLTKLSVNQIKKTISKFKKGLLHEPFQENRGKFAQNNRKITEPIFQWIRLWIQKRNSRWVLNQLKRDLRISFPQMTISIATLHKVVKEIGCRFRTVVPYPPAKNSDEIKRYRFFFAHKMMQLLSQNQPVIAIDESGLSCYRQKQRAWTHQDLLPSSNLGIFHLLPSSNLGIFQNTPNITLLLAVSQSQIIGYFLIEGSLTSMIFAEFILEVVRHAKAIFGEKTEPVLIMDNAQAHKGLFMKGLLEKEKIRTIYTPQYSPELNWIEFIFGLLKKRMDEIGVPREK